jgi:hypothetical protein
MLNEGPVVQSERRHAKNPIPEDLDQFLNSSQSLTLHQLESFGWHIQFVRHPLFQDPVIFIGDANNEIVGILQEDGSVTNDNMPVIRGNA